MGLVSVLDKQRPVFLGCEHDEVGLTGVLDLKAGSDQPKRGK
jgi:hypothetical protein